MVDNRPVLRIGHSPDPDDRSEEHTPNMVYFGFREGLLPTPLSYGPIATPELSEEFILNDLSVFTGALFSCNEKWLDVCRIRGDGRLVRDVDLIYIPVVPEPSTMALSVVGLVTVGYHRRRRANLKR